MRKRSKLKALAIAAAVAVSIPLHPAGAQEEGPVFVGAIGADDPVFWDGGYVYEDLHHSLPAGPSSPQINRCEQFDPCFVYELETTEPGARLRIGFDTPMRDNNFEIFIYRPDGSQASRQTNGNQYSSEAFIGNPAVGVWTITVAPYSARWTGFRMRAKLESAPHIPGPANEDNQLLPNLRVTRLWEFGFAAPLNPLNGLFPPDDINPPLEALGRRPLSCAIDEMVDDGVERCLRYSFALANLGPGNFDIRWSGSQFSQDQHAMTQCIQRTDGPPEARPAGTGSYHRTHGHWHYDDIIHHAIWRVLDTATGEMVAAGEGKKLGYSPADQGIAEWHKFTQNARGTSGQAGTCVQGASSRLGMSSGWGDAYRYQRPGNYVDFNVNGDGYYVVRTTVNPEGHVLETDTSDNTTYAYLHILGQDVRVIEVGIGEHPWDETKTIIDYPNPVDR